MKNSVKLLITTIIASNYIFADTNNIQIEKLVISPKIDNMLNFQLPQNDGFVWVINSVFNSKNSITNQSVSRVQKNGSITNFGNIPHPDIKSLEITNSNILMTTNSNGTALISYSFYNEKSQYQRVFYILKNKSWKRLPDFTDSSVSQFINQVYLDNNENAYFSTTNNGKFYSLSDGVWSLMNNPANDPKADIYAEKVFLIGNNSVYTTRINHAPGNNQKDIFQIFKYNSNSVDYSNDISLGDNEYSPACTTMVDDNTAIVAYLNNHSNLAKQLIRFDTVKLNNNISYPFPSQSNNNSLFGSIVSLGQSISNLVGSNKGATSTNSSEQFTTTIGEVDLNQFAYGYDVANVANRLSCSTIGDTSYFVLRTYGKYPDPQFVYFKVKNPSQTNNNSVKNNSNNSTDGSNSNLVTVNNVYKVADNKYSVTYTYKGETSVRFTKSEPTAKQMTLDQLNSL